MKINYFIAIVWFILFCVSLAQHAWVQAGLEFCLMTLNIELATHK